MRWRSLIRAAVLVDASLATPCVAFHNPCNLIIIIIVVLCLFYRMSYEMYRVLLDSLLIT